MLSKILAYISIILCLASTAISCSVPLSANTPDKISNDFVVNGVTYQVTSIDVWYFNDLRYVILNDAYNNYIELQFAGLGNPTMIENQIPDGTWTDFNATNFCSIFVYINSIGGNLYEAGATASSASITVGGTQGSSITINGSFTFLTPYNDNVQINYSGPYNYGEN